MQCTGVLTRLSLVTFDPLRQPHNGRAVRDRSFVQPTVEKGSVSPSYPAATAGNFAAVRAMHPVHIVVSRHCENETVRAME